MPTVPCWVVKCLRMICDPLIPDEYGLRLVPDTALQVLALGDVIVQEVEDAVRLLLVETH